MFGRYMPIWSVVLVEFCFAYVLEILMGSPCSFRLASRVFDPATSHPMHFETAIICATVGLVCLNFPFAFFTQLFFIQPLVRTVFKALFIKDIRNRQENAHITEMPA